MTLRVLCGPPCALWQIKDFLVFVNRRYISENRITIRVVDNASQKRLNDMRWTVTVLFAFLSVSNAASQEKKTTKSDRVKPSLEELIATYPSETLDRVECRLLSEMLVANKDALDLSRQQVAKLKKLSAQYDDLGMMTGIPREEAERLEKLGKDLGKELEARWDRFRKKSAEFEKTIIAESRKLLLADQLRLAKQIMFDELALYEGLAKTISMKPFSSQIRATPEQLKKFKALEDEARKNLGSLMSEAYTNADKKCFEMLNRVQQKTVKHDLGLEFKARNFKFSLNADPLRYMRDVEIQLEDGFKFGSLRPIGATVPESFIFNPEMFDHGMVSSFVVEQKDVLKLTKEQLKEIKGIQPKWQQRLEELLNTDEFKVLLDDESDLPDKELERIGIKYQEREQEIGEEMDQESVKVLRPAQLAQLKSIVFKNCLGLHHLSRILLEKPFVDDLEFTDHQKKRLVEVDRQSVESFKAVMFSVREELNKAVFEALDPGQQTLVKSWRLPSKNKKK